MFCAKKILPSHSYNDGIRDLIIESYRAIILD